MKLIKFFNLEALQKTTIFAAAAGIFIVVNLIAGYLSWRWDFTKDKMHTLSPQTRKIIRDLDDVATIKFFLSSDLPSRLLSLKTDVVDLLNEYKKAGAGKIIVKVLDPKKNPGVAEEAAAAGVPELKLSQVEKDKYAVSNTYFGIALSYGAKKEIIPQATNVGTLEYDLTSAVFKLTRKAPIKVGLVEGSPPRPPDENPLFTVKKILAQQFETEFIEASAKDKDIDRKLAALIVVDDGQIKYGAPEIARFDKYLTAGGKMVFAVDGATVREEEFLSAPAEHGLFPFFETYGVKLNREFVLSESSELASFTTGELGFITPYPFWVRTGRFDPASAEFAHITQLVFPWVASVATEKKPGVEAAVLVSSEDRSWIAPDTVSLSPQAITAPARSEMKKQPLIVEVKTKGGGAFILIPSSRFVSERFISRMPENVDAFVNIVNSYASDGALSGIRARSAARSPLVALSDKIKDIVKYLMIFSLPGLFAIAGAVRLVRRR